MKKYMLIAALCLLSNLCCSSTNHPSINFTIKTAKCPQSQMCLNAIVNEKNIGTIVFKTIGDYLHIIFIGVNPEFRKNGIGKALINAAEKQIPCHTIGLNALDPSLNFYQRLGFACDPTNYCTKPCNQSSFGKPAQTSKLGSQKPKSNGEIQ